MTTWFSIEPRQLALLDDLELIQRSKVMIEMSAQQVNDRLNFAGVERLWLEDGVGMTEYVAAENKGIRFGFRTLIKSPNPNHANVYLKTTEPVDPARALRDLLKDSDLVVHRMDDEW